MKKNVFLLFILISMYVSGQNSEDEFLTTNLTERVLHIKNGASTGSSYIIEKYDRSFLVTAKHIFPNLKECDSITFQVNQDKQWKNISGIAHLHKNAEIDVIIIDLGVQLFGNNPNSYMRSGSVVFGDEGYFLGFPMGFQTDWLPGKNQGLPSALIKRATFSGQIEINGILIPLLDGQNNPGFSGGPIFFKSYNKGIVKWSFFGIISGYYPQKNLLKTALGEFFYDENSGIIKCSSEIYITEIMEKL